MSREHLKEAAAEAEAEATRIAEEAAAYEPEEEFLTRLTPQSAVGINVGLVRIKKVYVDAQNRERVKTLTIPIKTDGVQAAAKKVQDEARLNPPMVDKLVQPSSEIGKALELTKAQVVSVIQAEDDGYQKRLQAHNLRLQWVIAATAIDVPLEFVPSGQTDARLATSLDERIDALRQAGFTNTQVSEINVAVSRIMTWTKQERARFFGENWD